MEELTYDPLTNVYNENRAMMKFLYSKGGQLPLEVMQLYGETEKEIHDNCLVEDEDKRINFARYENYIPLSIKLGKIHNALSEILEPAVPGSIYMIEEELEKNSFLSKFGCVPFIRRMMVVSIISMLTFILISLSSAINKNVITQSIFDLKGMELLKFFIFLLSASGLGASFSSLLRANRFIINRTFDAKYETSYWVRFIVGLMSGIIITELVPEQIFESVQLASKPTLALLGGFSADLVYKILEHLVSVVESALVPRPPKLPPVRKPSQTCPLMSSSMIDTLASGAKIVSDVHKVLTPKKETPKVAIKAGTKKVSGVTIKSQEPAKKVSVSLNTSKKRDEKTTTVEKKDEPKEQEKQDPAMAQKKPVVAQGSNNVTLDKFRGDLGWIHKREGHNGSPYWPGGESGVTLDPGIDLGYIDMNLVYKAYGDLFTQENIDTLKSVVGLKGDQAHQALKSNTDLKKIKINSNQAEHVFPVVADPYWEKIANRYPTLKDQDTLPAVQTALLSIAYNRGPNNPRLKVLDHALETKDWQETAQVIGDMQQNHKLEGIRKRRRMEAELIRQALSA